MIIHKTVVCRPTESGYTLDLWYSRGGRPVFTLRWPAYLSQHPDEFRRYMEDSGFVGQLRDALEIWYLQGYSVSENGWYLRGEAGGELSFADACARALKAGECRDPIHFLSVSLTRRPEGLVLREPPETVQAVLDMRGATKEMRKYTWDHVYAGGSAFDEVCARPRGVLYAAPGGEQYIAAEREDPPDALPHVRQPDEEDGAEISGIPPGSVTAVCVTPSCLPSEHPDNCLRTRFLFFYGTRLFESLLWPYALGMDPYDAADMILTGTQDEACRAAAWNWFLKGEMFLNSCCEFLPDDSAALKHYIDTWPDRHASGQEVRVPHMYIDLSTVRFRRLDMQAGDYLMLLNKYGGHDFIPDRELEDALRPF